MKEVAIIGGGVAGLFCSVYLKEQLLDAKIEDVTITIYERLEKTGKKLLVTGNGRCNYSNVHVSKNKYNCPDFVSKTIEGFTAEDVINYYKKLGLYSTIDGEGRIYPKSEVANTVLDVLRSKIRQYGIEERCNTEVKKITVQDEQFLIETGRNTKTTADFVILSTGGKVAQIHGSNGSGYQLLKLLKHKVITQKPGLVAVIVDETQVKGLTGIRTKAKVNLYDKKQRKVVWNEFGEVLYKQDGLSGIVIMQLASYMAHNPSQYIISLDLLPDVKWDDLFVDIKKRISEMPEFENTNLLTGFFTKMLNLSILKRAKIDISSYIQDLSDREIARIVSNIKEFNFDVKGTYNFDKAQVTIGGASIDEIDENSMESLKIPNLYVVGELLDIDGECGGYNLHWAFASGKVVASNIVKKICDVNKSSN